jgi:YhcH/YjgK/YiaL family protein
MNRYTIIAITFILIATACSSPKKGNGSSKETIASSWFNKKEYLDGLQLDPHQSADKVEFLRQYNANKDLWDKAFAYLKTTDLKTLPKGKYTIVPEKVTVSVTEDSTRNFEKTTWESHRKLIDIQYIISGEEKMGVAKVSSAKVTKPYDEKRDAANYEVDGKYYVSEPNKFFVFFPGDAHRPNITTSNNLPDKKIVIKIAAAQ